LPIFFTDLAPSHLFQLQNILCFWILMIMLGLLIQNYLPTSRLLPLITSAKFLCQVRRFQVRKYLGGHYSAYHTWSGKENILYICTELIVCFPLETMPCISLCSQGSNQSLGDSQRKGLCSFTSFCVRALMRLFESTIKNNIYLGKCVQCSQIDARKISFPLALLPLF
jgi:hypothetical protein